MNTHTPLSVDLTPLQRMNVSLDGLSVGDAFGQRFFGNPYTVEMLIAARAEPQSPWGYTDDTEMALSVVEVLERAGTVDQEVLARLFSRRYLKDQMRGYGGTAHSILQAIGTGTPWQSAAGRAFDGMGSKGNGAAMRVAPLGAYFAGDTARVVAEARRSAQVTHAHEDAQAGAVAVALAASWAWEHRMDNLQGFQRLMLECVHEFTPASDTRDGIAKALSLGDGASLALVVSALGNGTMVLSSDTVPFALWCAASRMDHFEEAMWLTVEGLGDRDTTCAMVGGIVALSTATRPIENRVSPEWLSAREPLPNR